MINLLPPDTKDSYRYARRNRRLIHWVVAATFSLAGALALLGGGYLYMNQTISDTQQQIADTKQQLASQNLPAVQKQVSTISNNLKLTVQVLSQEVLFSKLLKQLAAVTPNNVILTNLAITQAQGGVELTAETTNYQAATQMQVNLADPQNKIFSKADIVSINCQSGSSAINSQYPCQVDIRALFATNNPFLFTNDKGSK